VSFTKAHENVVADIIRGVHTNTLTAMACLDIITNEVGVYLTIIEDDGEGGKRAIPLARLLDGDPYKTLMPPPALSVTAHEIVVDT